MSDFTCDRRAKRKPLVVREGELNVAFIETFRSLKNLVNDTIRDRAVLENNFRANFDELNRVKVTDAEFSRLLEEIITPVSFSAAGALRERNLRHDVLLCHLRLLQEFDKDQKDGASRSCHSALSRQVLENVASFLGVGQFGVVLEQRRIGDTDEVAGVKTPSHTKVFYDVSDERVPDTPMIFEKLFDGLKAQFSVRATRIDA
jgi:hypothetical protein